MPNKLLHKDSLQDIIAFFSLLTADVYVASPGYCAQWHKPSFPKCVSLGKIWDRGFQPCWLTQPGACTEILLWAFSRRLAPHCPPSFLGHVQYPRAHLLKSLFSSYVQCWMPGVIWETKLFFFGLSWRPELQGAVWPNAQSESRKVGVWVKRLQEGLGCDFWAAQAIRSPLVNPAFFTFSSFCISCTDTERDWLVSEMQCHMLQGCVFI